MANQRPQDLLQCDPLVDCNHARNQRQRDRHLADGRTIQAQPRPGRGQGRSPGQPDSQGLPGRKSVGQRLRRLEGRDRLGLVACRALAATCAHGRVEVLLQRRRVADKETPPEKGRRNQNSPQRENGPSQPWQPQQRIRHER